MSKPATFTVIAYAVIVVMLIAGGLMLLNAIPEPFGGPR